ncbi:MAG TPA: DUF2378 family protein [Myxococcales bacterium]|nr:DUF2378 family protein [Myxococcales bacterium]
MGDLGADAQTLGRIAAGCLQVDPSGTAFFVSEQLAVAASAYVSLRWREQPEVTLHDAVRSLAVPARVVAEHQALGIVLLETEAPAAGLGAVAGTADARTAEIPAAEISELIAFYTKARGQPREAKPVIYDSTVEGVLLRGLGGLLTPGLKSKLRALGIDFDRGLRPTYPRAVWNQALAVVVAEVFPGVTLEEGYRKLGELSFRGLRDMPAGRPVSTLAQWVGPRGSILRLPEGCSSVNNYMKMMVDELAPNHFRLYLNETHGCPAYAQGAIWEALTVGGAKDLRISIREATVDAACFDIRWAPDE